MKGGKRPAEGEMSSWERWNLSKRLKTGRARPNAAKKEQLPEKKPEAPPPPPLVLWFLEDPERAAYYKLDLTYKASLPLHKLRLPLLPQEDDPAKGHNLCIHGLQEVKVTPYINDGYRVVEQRVQKPKFGHHSPAVYYKDLMSEYWPRLVNTFKTDEEWYAYQNSKHNLDRYPKERFLLNGVLLGGGYINLIEGILKKHNYVAGPTRYNCLEFVDHLEDGLKVNIEVEFEELPHRFNCPLGLVKLCILLNDSTWQPRSLTDKIVKYVSFVKADDNLDKQGEPTRHRRKVTKECVFLLEDFRESVEYREQIEDAKVKAKMKAKKNIFKL